MKLKSYALAALSSGILFAGGTAHATESHQDEAIQKIAFGSCNNPRKGISPMFDVVVKERPDVFVFLGDNIYGDTEDMEVLRAKWQELGDIEAFQILRENTTLLATWDDHDFGVNDGGKSYEKRKDSERIFLDFFEEPDDSPRLGRDGVHGSYTFGPPGRTCQILLLDTRYFRDELPRAEGPKAEGVVGWYEPTEDTSKTLLGEGQWEWLEQQLQVPADIRIIGSSIQVVAHEKGMENWGNVPHERNRLFELLKKHDADGTFAISGDVHFAELSKMDVDGYPFFDLTSSGMTNTQKEWAKARNSFRVGKSHPVRNAGIIEIDWENKAVELSIIDEKGEKILRHPVDLADLEFR